MTPAMAVQFFLGFFPRFLKRNAFKIFLMFFGHPYPPTQAPPLGTALRHLPTARLQNIALTKTHEKWRKADTFRRGESTNLPIFHEFFFHIFWSSLGTLGTFRHRTPNYMQCPGEVSWFFWHLETRSVATFEHMLLFCCCSFR